MLNCCFMLFFFDEEFLCGDLAVRLSVKQIGKAMRISKLPLRISVIDVNTPKYNLAVFPFSNNFFAFLTQSKCTRKIIAIAVSFSM